MTELSNDRLCIATGDASQEEAIIHGLMPLMMVILLRLPPRPPLPVVAAAVAVAVSSTMWQCTYETCVLVVERLCHQGEFIACAGLNQSIELLIAVYGT